MWVIYRKSDRKIVGLSPDCKPDLKKDFALKEVVKGLVESGPLKNYDAIQISDRAQARDYIGAFPATLVLRKKEKGKVRLSIEKPEISSLVLQCDAEDIHPVDGVPEIPADGTSFTKISVQKIDERGKPQKGKKDNDSLYLRTDYGTLRSVDGAAEVSTVKLDKGQATFRLVSEKAKRVATVQVLNVDPKLEDVSLLIEFI